MCSALKDLAANVTLHGGDMYNDPSDWLFDDTYVWSTVYRWVGRDCRMPDPGMYAVVGMAAFLSGSGRITLMLATVIIELTDDASLIGPVGVASIIAMIVGNMFNHGLYHGLIPVMNMPYLNNEPADVMHLVRVGDIMAREVICLSKMAKPTDIERLIRQCDIGEVTHHAFPVVDEEIEGKMRGKKLRGLIALDALKSVMKSAGAEGSTNKRRRRLMQGSESVVRFEKQEMSDEVISQLCEWLVHVPLMHDLSHGVLEQIARGMRRGTVQPGEDIIHVGEPGAAMYFLGSGSADAFVRDVSVFSYAECGKFFGELALLTDEPRKATVRAGEKGATVWELDRTIFEETLSLNDRDINLLKYADRSPLTVAPHTKVARAFEVFRKLGMRHLCVTDGENNLVGMVTRKDLMTYKIVDNIMTPRAEAVIRGWVYKFRARKAAEAAEAAAAALAASKGQAVLDPSPRTVRSMKLGVKVGKWEVNAHLHQQQQQQQQQQQRQQQQQQRQPQPPSVLPASSPSAVNVDLEAVEELQLELATPAPPLTAPPVVRTPRMANGNGSGSGNGSGHPIKLAATMPPEPAAAGISSVLHVADEELLTAGLGDDNDAQP
jgi:CBS domain-containing protein